MLFLALNMNELLQGMKGSFKPMKKATIFELTLWNFQTQEQRSYLFPVQFALPSFLCDLSSNALKIFTVILGSSALLPVNTVTLGIVKGKTAPKHFTKMCEV